MNVTQYNTVLNEQRLPILREMRKYQADPGAVYNNPEKIAHLAAEIIGLKDAAEEYAYCFSFDTRSKLTGLFEVSHGTVNASLMSSREIMQKLLFLNAVYFVVVHNHPAGDVTPSGPDMAVTKQLHGAGELMQIKMMDHIIVGGRAGGDYQYYSMREQGVMPEEVAS